MEKQDLLQQYLGDFGRFQKFTALLVVLVSPIFGSTVVAMAFLMATPEHHCRINGTGPSAGYGLSPESLNHSIPMENLGDVWVYSSCFMYSEANETTARENLSRTACSHGWEYDRSQYRSTVSTEFDLVCDRAWLNELGRSVFFVGVSLGGMVAGIASDRFGRQPTTVVFILLHLILGVGVAFTTDYVTFVILRALVGAAGNGFFFTALVIAVEVCGPSKRNAVGMASIVSCSLGFVVVGCLAFFIREWWTLQLTQALMTIPFICYWWLLPESPRWLLTKNRIADAKIIIKRAAIMNNVNISDDVFDGLTEKLIKSGGEDSKKHSLLDLFRGPRLRKTTTCMCFAWFLVVIVYFGLILGSVNLAGNPYLNFCLGALLEAGLSTLSLVAMERWGRKPVVGGAILLAGTGCMVSAMTLELPTVARGFGLAGRGLIGISFSALIAYSPEVFPTVVRGMGMGLANMCARLGASLAPFVPLLGDVWLPLPMITFGIMCCLASLAVSLLPETLGVPLPDTLEDCEKLGRKESHVDDLTEMSYTDPWPVPAPMRHMRRVVVCYQAARDGSFFSSALMSK